MDEAAKPAAGVVAEAVDAPSKDSPKPVKRTKGKRKPSRVAATSPTGAAQAFLGLPATGKMDHATKAAVRAFQRPRGLTVNGRLDEPTKKALGL